MRNAPEAIQSKEGRSTKNIIVGTAGHIDHGKSALVQALTGTNPDRLEEERRRGITIDIGFAFLELGGVRIGFVDVPGHERFIHNMLAGAGGIDFVLLVIAANEGIKPQTREHFEICRMLGISRGVVALTKIDTVDPARTASVTNEVQDFVYGSFLEAAPIVPISARTGTGLDALRAALSRAAGDVSPKDSARYFCLPVDRAFAMKGFGTVVTGTLVSGTVAMGDEVELQPSRRSLRVRGVHSEGKSIERAHAGQRTALNLAGIELSDVRRGMVLTVPGRFTATRHIHARVKLLKSAPALKNHARLQFHQGVARTAAEITFLDAPINRSIVPPASFFARVSLKEEVFLLSGDRFILRQHSPAATIGGGTVLETLSRTCTGRAETLRLLSIIESGDKEEILLAICEIAKRQLSMDGIIARTAWLEAEVRATARSLAAKNAVCILSQARFAIASSNLLDECRARILEHVSLFHQTNALTDGIGKEELRTRVGAKSSPELFHAALEGLLISGQLSASGEAIKLSAHTVALSPEESRALREIESACERSGLAPDSEELLLQNLGLDLAKGHRLLHLLLQQGILVKVAEGMFVHKNALDQLRRTLQTQKSAHGTHLTIAAFKELAGVSRKHAIPLLVYLDRIGTTRRQRDERVIM